jgi:hypothetical protein
MRTCVGFAAMLAVSLYGIHPAAAQEGHDAPTRGAVMIFPGEREEAAPPDGVEAPKERGWHINGANYASGDGWFVLACANDACRIAATRMNAQSLPIQPHYDDAEPAQFLTWQPLPDGEPLLFFKPHDARITFAPGPLRTWLRPASNQPLPPAPPNVGSMATAIPLGGDASALLVPRISPSTNPDYPGDEVWIELRLGGKRQRLGVYRWYEDGIGVIGARDYLVWAGDLDGDGKLDLLMRWNDYDVDQTLFLSSLAKPGEIVGEAGAISYWPPQMGD